MTLCKILFNSTLQGRDKFLEAHVSLTHVEQSFIHLKYVDSLERFFNSEFDIIIRMQYST